jgi:hypothetical protein
MPLERVFVALRRRPAPEPKRADQGRAAE